MRWQVKERKEGKCEGEENEDWGKEKRIKRSNEVEDEMRKEREKKKKER